MRKNRNRPESDEPLSEGRVEYLEAARQRVRNRRIRRAAVLLVLTRWVKQTKKLHPILFILFSAVVGVAFGF